MSLDTLFKYVPEDTLDILLEINHQVHPCKILDYSTLGDFEIETIKVPLPSGQVVTTQGKTKLAPLNFEFSEKPQDLEFFTFSHKIHEDNRIMNINGKAQLVSYNTENKRYLYHCNYFLDTYFK